MTKIADNKYVCDWCGEIIEKKVGKYTSSRDDTFGNVKGHQNATAQLICPKCGRYISQKVR